MACGSVACRTCTEDCFLNVMQVADNTCKRMHDVKRIDAEKVVGVQIADRVVTFSRDSSLCPAKSI